MIVFPMARMARTVVAGLPHHVTQRGNRREAIFFEDGDQEIYRDLLAEQTRKAGVEVWAYCLTPNHVHLILIPTRHRPTVLNCPSSSAVTLRQVREVPPQ
jgi:REP element-mobilizing transposase RayT